MSSVFIRSKYLGKIEPFIGKSIIKVLTGQRRVGKTVILRQLIDLIAKEDTKANTIYINKEHNDFKDIKTAEDLFQFVKLKTKKNKNNYVFIDEIQEI